MRANPIRFTGMASGMDTDSIVRDLMAPQKFKIDREKKAQALVKLREDAWKDMNRKLYDFHRNFTDKLSMASSFNASIATSNNESIISIAGGNSIPLGTHKFEIGNLATSTSVSGQIVKGGLNLDNTTKVGELGITGEVTLAMKVNGNDISFKVAEGDTLASVATKMNKALEGQGFKARYDAANGMFFINATKSGAGQTISFEGDSGSGLFEKLGITTDGVEPGQDASFSYNGVGGFTSSTNNIDINGIKVTLKSVGEVIISSEPDADATYNFVKEFVTEYNKLIDEINEKLGAKPGKDIEPLTSEERESMSESDIKLWEEKLNSSLFYKDEQLEKFANTARTILGSVFADGDDGFKSLDQLGIVTGEWREKGKLHILGDKDDDNPKYSGAPNKLKAAISENPDGVIKLLSGLGDKLYKAHEELLKSSDLNSKYNFYNDKAMQKQLESHNKRIMTLEERMYRMEEMHYAKFAKMETLLSSLNNQSSWLSQQFGG